MGPSAAHSMNSLKAALIEGRPTFGLIATMPSIQVVQALASAGVDWLLIDMEHGPIDYGSAHAMIVAMSGTPMVPRCAPHGRTGGRPNRSWTSG